jgi:hypothetical protein
MSTYSESHMQDFQSYPPYQIISFPQSNENSWMLPKVCDEGTS